MKFLDNFENIIEDPKQTRLELIKKKINEQEKHYLLAFLDYLDSIILQTFDQVLFYIKYYIFIIILV